MTDVAVERIEIRGEDDVRLHSPSGSMRARHVVVAAGGWAARLLTDVPGVTLPQLRLTQEQPALFAPIEAPWPSFIHHVPAETPELGVYGLGGTEGVKIGHHGVGREVRPQDRRDDAAVIDDAAVALLVDYARRWLPGVDVDRVAAQICTYTTTVDSDFAIGRAGPVTIATGFSGHGFKFGPVLGELVAGHVLGTVGGAVSTELHVAAAERFSLTRSRTAPARP
jgi:sarcosine oxidase